MSKLFLSFLLSLTVSNSFAQWSVPNPEAHTSDASREVVYDENYRGPMEKVELKLNQVILAGTTKEKVLSSMEESVNELAVKSCNESMMRVHPIKVATKCQFSGGMYSAVYKCHSVLSFMCY